MHAGRENKWQANSEKAARPEIRIARERAREREHKSGRRDVVGELAARSIATN